MDKSAPIAVVEDPFIRKFVGDLLASNGYRVLEPEVQGALEMLRSGTEKLGLVITNQPADFVAYADRVPVLYIAAAPDEALASRFRACRILRKPFVNQQLLEAVHALVA